MNQKIGTFLMAMLVITAVLLLMATAQDAPAGTPSEPVQTTADRQTEPPQTAQTTAPEQTEPTRKPETAALVERVLDEGGLDQTAVTLHAAVVTGQIDGAAGQADASAVHALARIAGERRMNPIAAFWLLVSEGMYEKREDQSDGMKSAAFEAPGQAAKQYAYTDEGSRQLLTDLLAVAAEIPDELDLETALLGEKLSLEPEQVHESKADGCRYAYFSCSSEYATHILCFYLRSNAGEGWINDVEFQLLSMRHADGETAALAVIDDQCARQAVSLMAAAELVLTGSTRTGEGKIPFGYEIGGCQAKLGRYDFTARNERGSLINYRLRAK